MQAVRLLMAKTKFVSHYDALSLLEWMQDMHWEVAHPIADYMRAHVNKIHSEIISIFQSEDNEWKFNLIMFILLDNINLKVEDDLLSVLKKMAANPSFDEKDNDVDEVCKELLGSIGYL